MKMDLPLVSVIIPSYNHEKYIEEAIRSVWEQTYSNVELIVLDDGSKDNSPEIIKALENISPIPMKIVLKSNDGLCKTLNKGLIIAEGSYISLLASDDRYFKNHLHILMDEAISCNINFGIIFGNSVIIDEKGERTGMKCSSPEKMKSGMIFENILFFEFFMQGAANLYQKKILLEVNGFNEKNAGEGLDLYLKITKRYPCIYINKDLAEYRVIKGNTSNLNTTVAQNPEKLIEIVSSNIKNYHKEDNCIWKRKVYGNLYRRIAQNYYSIRDFSNTQMWLRKSIMKYPFHYILYKLYFRTLFGKNIINYFTSTLK